MAYSSAVAVTATPVVRAGITDTLPTTPTDVHGNKVLYDPTMWLEVNNGSGSPITVTIDIPRLVDGQAVTDPTVTVNAGVRKKIGPFTPDYEQTDGYVWFVFSAVTSVTIGAFRL